MFGEKFVEFYDNLIKNSQINKENSSKKKDLKNQKDEEEEEIINDHNLNDKSKSYIEKHIITLIDTSINKFLSTNQKYSYYLKFIQNIYCDISDFSNYFPNFKSLKMVLKLYFIIMRTYYYNNQKLEKILVNQENFTTYIDYFFKDIFLYVIKIFPNIDINNKKNILELNIDKIIVDSFIGKALPFIKNDGENNSGTDIDIPMNILYNISDYRHDIMKEIKNKDGGIIKYFEKQEKSLKMIGIDIEGKKEKCYLSVIIYFLNEIKERYFVDRFIKYLELNEDDKKVVLNNINII